MPITRSDLVEQADGSYRLYVPQGGDLAFEVEWQDNTETTVPITAADGEIRRTDTDVEVLDFSPYISIVAEVAQVLIPASVTKALEDWGEGYWSLVATSDTGSTMMLMDGPAYLRRGAARD